MIVDAVSHTFATRLSRRGIPALGLPLIGCGIGGLDWKDVSEIMERVSQGFPAVELTVVTLPS